MVIEPMDTSDDIFTRLQAIHDMFNSPKTQDERPVLTRMEKVDPSEKLIGMLKMYETCDGSVEDHQIEKMRKEYFEGLQFNTMQTALQLFKSSAEHHATRNNSLQSISSSAVPINIVSKGTTDDIRSVFVDAITYDNSLTETQLNAALTDDQWLHACNEGRVRKLLTLSQPYLRSYREMANDLVLDSVRRAFHDVSREISAHTVVATEDGQLSQPVISDRQWFLQLNDIRVENLIQLATAKSAGKLDLTPDMWSHVRSALLHCVSSTASLFNRQSSKMDKDNLPPSIGLTSNKVAKILAEIKKEFKRSNKQLDMKIVEGITSDLKKRIQSAMNEHDKRRSSKYGQLDATPDDSGTQAGPEKLTAERLNRIFTDYKKEYKKSVDIDPNEFEGLTSSIKEKILSEMSKKPVIAKSTEIDVDVGTASMAKQRFMDDITERRTVKHANTTEQPKAIDQEKLNKFNQNVVQDTSRSDWIPDVEMQAGLAKDRVMAFSTDKEYHRTLDWTPDVPITTGIARDAVANLMTEKLDQGREIPWSLDVVLESGLAKDRVQKLLAAAAPMASSGTHWQPDIDVKSGNVGEKADLFMKDVSGEMSERDWKPDVELPSGLTQQRINSLYTQSQNTPLQGNLRDAKDANDLIHLGLTKERVSEFLSTKEREEREWQPDVELRKGLTKERTSLFHNLETMRQSEQKNSEEQDELRQFATTAGAKRVVIEVENDPLPPDPNIARNDKTTEYANVQSGHTKLILEKLKSAYNAADEKSKDDTGVPLDDLSLSSGHAQTLLHKFEGFETNAKTVHTTAEKTSDLPRRFVSNPAPVPIQCDIVTEEKCLCCKQPVYSTEGINIQNKGFVHKKCMRCPNCKKIPPHAEAVFIHNQIYCREHSD